MSIDFKPKGSGDLRALVQKLQRVKAAELTRSLGQAALKLVVEGFENESDPYEKPWEKPKGREGQALSDTGRLRNSWRVASTPKVVRLKNATVYAAIHQFGGVIEPRRAKALRFKIGGRWITAKRVRIPSRKMVPVERQGLGRKWEKAFRDECAAFFKELLS